MSNRNFNKQTTNARQALADGGPAGTGKGAAPFKGPRKPKMARPSLGDKIKKARPTPDPRGTGKGVRPKPTPRKPSPKMIEYFKKRKQDKDIKTMERPKPRSLRKPSESPERIKKQADYMKKHGKNESRRKTLSVKNTYKKEVEGLKK